MKSLNSVFKTTRLAAGVATALLCVAAPMNAVAGAKAIGYIDSENAVLFDGTGVTDAATAAAATIITQGVEITLPTAPTTTSTARGLLNGTAANTGGIGQSDAPQACVDSGGVNGATCTGIGENNYTQQALTTPSFSRGDSVLTGAVINIPIDPGPPPVILPGGASADVIAETQLREAGAGNSGSTIGTVANFTFTAGSNGPIGLRFDATPFLEVLLNPDVIPISSATAGINLSVRITDTSTNSDVLDWTPDGSLSTITIGTEFSDPFSLTQSIGTQTAGANTVVNGALSSFFFAANSLALVADGRLYDFSISAGAVATAQKTLAVPEPASLMLFGTGLLGLSAGAFRRKRQQRS